MKLALLLPWNRWANRSRGSIALLILTPFACAAALSWPLVREGTWADFGFDSVAWLLFVAGATTRWWASLYIEGRKSRSVVDAGPYSMCRNPLYLGTFLMGVSVVVYMKSPTFAVGFLLAAIVYLIVTLPVEEQRLLRQLGSDYDRYCQRVPRFIPRPALFHTSTPIEVNILGIKNEAIRAARWMWVPVLCELMDHLRVEAWWPHVSQFR